MFALNLAGIVALIFFALAGPAAAQAPLLELSQQVVAPGTTVTVTVIGTPFQFFGVASSASNTGLGGGFELGPDFIVIGSGQLDATGRGTFPLLVGAAPNPLYVQGATSPDPGFSTFVPTPGKAIAVSAVAAGGGQIFSAAVAGNGTTTLWGAVNGVSQAGSEVSTVFARACTATNLVVQTTPALDLAGSPQIAVTLRRNGADSLGCTVPAGGNDCSSGTATQAIEANDLVSVRIDFANVIPATRVTYGFVCG